MNWRLFFTKFLILVATQLLLAQETPLWMRYPAISPDGNQIVFSYKGDLYKVAATGGTARALTLHQAHDYKPVWSKDGKQIAFASNRYGNFDVYVMSAEGGKPSRLTFHSSDDFPSDFTKDNDAVLFSSLRLDDVKNRMFPSGRMAELYQVPTKGGRVKQILTIPAADAKYSKDGKMIVYHDKKGYEDEFRKHHTSSVTRDIWTYNISDNNYTKVTTFNGEDRNPVFSPDGKELFYLSEASGSFNVHAINLSNTKTNRKVTKLKNHPVRTLSISNSGLMCYSYNGELYTLKDGASPKKVVVKIIADDRYNAEKRIPVNAAGQMDVSPNGKEIVFVNRGEIFVSSVESGMTKRITNTPERERTASFSPDGRSIVYASERNGSWNLYQTKLSREGEQYFFNSTVLKEEAILESAKETFQPAFSPDGKEVAFLEERTTLKVINLASKQERVILTGDRNYSYADGDQSYAWSPDGKWFLVNFLQPQQWIDEVGLIKADGKESVINLTRSGYSDNAPSFTMDGKMIIWASGRDGLKAQASWGGQADIYGMFLTEEGWDRFNLTKEEFALLKEKEKKEKKKDKDEDKKDDEGDKDEIKLKPMEIDFNGIYDRKKRLTIHSSSIMAAEVSKDGEKLYYMARFEKGFDLWETNLRTRETKVLMKLGSRGGGMELSNDGKYLFIVNAGKLSRIELSSKKKKSISIKGEMILKEAEERAYLFEHAWRQVVKKFYKEDLHGVDWNFYKKEYVRFLPHINNGFDFSEMMSELLGELNASHTGCRYRSHQSGSDATASLGVYYDNGYTGKGLKIAEVIKKGPFDKKASKVKAGIIIEKIDGTTILPEMNFYPLLNRKSGKYTLVALFDPASGERWEETIKPISRGAEFGLRYKRWVENCREITERVSNGRIGYVHVRGMNTESYKTVYEEVLGRNAGMDAVIVDTRFNGGGWLHDDLATFLSGKIYMKVQPRGQDIGREPMFKWYKPSCVLMGEGNYSDAHLFPYTYKALGVGKLVGMPVPGTGTAVWWEGLPGGYVFGIPQVGMVGNDGSFMENTQLEPDVKVANDPAKVTNGIDQQIEAAVKELLRQVDGK